MRIISTVSFLVLLGLLGASVQAAAEGEKAPKGTSDAKFDQFKQLAGDWVGKMAAHAGKEEMEINVNYKLTSAGSVVVETLTPGKEHEMVTVIHKDGDDLVLTHYCALGNQPHMKAERKGDKQKVIFQFTGGSNMKSDKEMHMHAVTYTFLDKDTLKAEWTHYNDGKQAGMVVFELKRKK